MTITILLFAASALFALLAIHPFLTYPLSLWLLARRSRSESAGPARDTQAERLTFTICMCAYNEESVIRQKAQNLLALRRRTPDVELLVYIDAATDATAERLAEFGDNIDVYVSKERRGKTYGMNLLAARARGSILVFTDANVMLDEGCLEALRDSFSDPSIGCVCGNLIYTNDGVSATASTGSLYWRLEEWIKSLEHRTGSVMGADGSLFAIRRSLHHPPPENIIDDMYVSFMVLFDGYRIVRNEKALAYEESVTASREEFLRKVRIACQAFNVHRLIWPKLRRCDALTLYKYVSHKLLRWLSIYFLSLSGLAFLAALCASGRSTLALGLAGFACLLVVLGHRSVRPFSQMLEVLMSLAGAGLGVWRSLRGDTYQTWTPAGSIRQIE